MCINIANVGHNPYIPLHAHVIEIALGCGFHMRGEIIWDKGTSTGLSCAWGSWQSASNPVLRDVHEYILVFSKGSYKRRALSAERAIDSIERDDFLEFTKSVWKFPAASARQANRPAPFPVELPRRLIQLYSFKGDLVLDPFMQSGDSLMWLSTTAEAAVHACRRYVGYKRPQINESKKSETSPFGTDSPSNHDTGKFYNTRLYEGLFVPFDDSLNGSYYEGEPAQVNRIFNGDSRHMKNLPDESVHLMITSPPYNVGKEYDKDLSLLEYKELLSAVTAETYRTLVTGGRMCINIANVGRSPYIPLHAHIIEIALECGFHMRGEIIWDKGASAGSSCAWGSWRSASNPVLRDVHEYILVFSKGSYKRRTKDDSKGADSIERDDFLEFTKSVWKFPAASARQANHPAPFPVELPLRLIHLYSFEGDLVLDPFMGSGTTAEAAVRAGRRYVGYEIDARYVEQAEARLAELESAGNQLPLEADRMSG